MGVSKGRHGPWALIVGGSEGIGSALAERIGAEGINLVLVARKAEPLEACAGRIRQLHGVEVRTLSLDICATNFMEVIKSVTADIEVGLLVHNVGAGGGWGPFLDRPLEDALAAINANPVAAAALVHHFAPDMVRRGAGGILFIGSMAGNAGGAGLASYSAAKAYIQVFAEALWAELTPQGVDVLDLVVASADTPSRQRSGTQDDTNIAVASSDSVARQALEQLGDGPVQPQAGNEPFFENLAKLPRREPVAMIRDVLMGMAPT